MRKIDLCKTLLAAVCAVCAALAALPMPALVAVAISVKTFLYFSS